MRDYGVVSPMFWIGKTGRALRKYPDAQRVAIYFMTAPSSEMTGVFYCPLASILNDVGLFEAPSKPLTSPSQGGVGSYDSPLEGVKSAIVKLMELGFCVYDFESEFVFVTEMARWQIGESLKEKDNRIVGVKKSVKSMPKPLASLFLARYNEVFCLGYNLEDFQVNESPFEAPCKPLRSQEQEQEQDIYSDTNVSLVETDVCDINEPDELVSEKVEKKQDRESCPYQSIVTEYNAILGSYIGECRSLTATRKQRMRSRWIDAKKDGCFQTEAEGIAYFHRYFEYVSTSDFLMGRSKPRFGESKAWRANFDFLFKPDNFVKIIEGTYHRR